jgi:hypothetical protein
MSFLSLPSVDTNMRAVLHGVVGYATAHAIHGAHSSGYSFKILNLLSHVRPVQSVVCSLTWLAVDKLVNKAMDTNFEYMRDHSEEYSERARPEKKNVLTGIIKKIQRSDKKNVLTHMTIVVLTGLVTSKLCALSRRDALILTVANIAVYKIIQTASQAYAELKVGSRDRWE